MQNEQPDWDVSNVGGGTPRGVDSESSAGESQNDQDDDLPPGACYRTNRGYHVPHTPRPFFYDDDSDVASGSQDTRPSNRDGRRTNKEVRSFEFAEYQRLNGDMLLGKGVEVNSPLFHQGKSSSSGWMMYADCRNDVAELVPARAMCFNIPVECFGFDASKFTDWQTPMNNSVRAASIAALLGMVATPLSKGWLSGNHEEEARADQQAQGNSGREGNADGDSGEVKKPKRVHQYMMQDTQERYLNLPMIVIGFEDIYNAARESVVAIRIWHFVFDRKHSTSELARKLMNENADEADHSGSAHCPNNQRKTSVVSAAKATRTLIGASLESAKLELTAGLCYRHVLNESVYKSLLGHYAGHSDKSQGRPPIDLAHLPAGSLNKHLSSHEEYGSDHPLGFEWVFNAKRPDALLAGLVHLNGTFMDVHPDQIDVKSYFNMPTDWPPEQTRSSWPQEEVAKCTFRVPNWVGSDVGDGKGCFFFQTDPNQLNIFDMVLPHAIAGSIKPGRRLLELYQERFYADCAHLAVDSPLLLSRFNNTMTGRDQWMLQQITSLADSIVNYDTMDTSAEQRMDVRSAKKAAARGIASYGQMDGDDHIVEPRQVLKEHAFTTSNVHARLIAPWVAETRHSMAQEEERLRDVRDKDGNKLYEDADYATDDHFRELRARRTKFDLRHTECMRELVTLHLAKMERSFTSRIDKESIPAGYRAVWDGLQAELADMPANTANIAFWGRGNQLIDSDRTVFGHMTNWLGTFFEEDCFVDGRDWRLMQELFYHCFEQFGEQTLLLILCGPKGNGKTLRTERAMRAFVKNWITMSGPSSAKAGMQGNSDSCNGCNCIYDEMIDELTDGDGSNRTEYWKMILLKREYVYNKPVVVKGADGREMHRTFKLKTPHQETHCVCTNRGPAFTKGDEDPTEVKSALIDRAVVQFVRTLGAKTHDDQELEDHLSDPAVARKLRMFRIMTCLMAMLKLLIFRQPYLKPDLAFAQKLWDQWDEKLHRQYGLPKASPRKNIKRLENLITMCCQNAVGHVFFYKQTAWHFEAGQTTEEFPQGKPFQLSMLWECVQLLQPTREMIHMAWTMGLEYNIGTSAMGLNTMTICSEIIGRQCGDWFSTPPENYASYIMENDELTQLSVDAEAASRQRAAAAGAPALPGAVAAASVPVPAWNPPSVERSRLPEFERIFSSPQSYMTVEQITRMKLMLSAKREARSEYQFLCSRSEMKNVVMKDAEVMVNTVIGDKYNTAALPLPDQEASFPQNQGRPSSEGDSDADETPEERGRRMYHDNESDTGISPDDCGMLNGFHEARAMDYPGNDNCPFIHEATPESMRKCPYCRTSLAEAEERAERAGFAAEQVADVMRLSTAASMVFPDLLDAGMFYKPQTLVQFAASRPAFIDPSAGCPPLATRETGNSTVNYMEKTNSLTGASRKDIGWMQGKGDQWKKWGKAADYIRGKCLRPVMEFDFHSDGLRDCLYLCSTRDNARLVPEEPRLLSHSQPERALKTMDDKRVHEDTACVQVADYSVPGGKTTVCSDHAYEARDWALANDSPFQRRLDSLFHGNRLSALNILTSNNVKYMPPIRMHADGICFSVGAMHAHTLLVAESVLTCALVPGLKNMQEKFSNNHVAGPPGLRNVDDKFANNHGTGLVSLGSSDNSGSKVTGTKRTVCDQPKDDNVHTLPYSYDLVSMKLGIDMADMFYDDRGAARVERAVATHKSKCGLDIAFENLPHLSLRYIGYGECNRQTLSLKTKAMRSPSQAYCEAGDPSREESQITMAHVRRSLGHAVSEEETDRYISRRQGARAMSGITGDLFAYSTWLEHTLTTMRLRGLISDLPAETAVATYADMEHCIRARVDECCTLRKFPMYERFSNATTDDSMFQATPGTYAALEKKRAQQTLETPGASKKTKRRQSNSSVHKDETLDYVGNYPEQRAPDQSPFIRLGEGPQIDRMHM